MNRSSLLWILGLSTWASSALAAEPRSSLAYSAPPGCPSRDALVEGVTARAPAARFIREKSALHAFRVAVSSTSGGFRAAIAMRDAETEGTAATETRRLLKGATCVEVVDAAAVVIALAIDPHASLYPRSEITVDAGAIASVPVKAVPLPAVVSEPDPMPTIDAPTVPPLMSLPPPWSAFTVARLESEIGTLPHGSAGIAIGVGVDRARGAFFAAFAIEVSLATSDWAGTTVVGSYSRAMARLEACPWSGALGDVLSARACAWIGAGALRAEGTPAPIPLSETIVWTDTGLGMRLRAARKKVFFEIGAGAVIPLERPRFVLAAPRVVLYQTPAVGGLLSIGAGVRFE